MTSAPIQVEPAAALRLRDARPDDLATVDRLIRALAKYERLEHEAQATHAQLRGALFGPSPKVFAVLCEWDGKPVGLCIWFYSFSTFLGRHGIYIEDIFVEPEFRGRGIGREVFRHLARRAVAEDCGRIEWQVLNWNEPAIGFYRGLGAEPRTDWHVQRLTGDALQRLAQGGKHG